MKISFIKYMQECIYYATTVDESSSPIDMVTGNDEVSSWCRAVNLIYRCLISNIWTAENAADYMPSWFKKNGFADDYDFCKKLSENSPFVYDNINMRYWLEPVFCNTDFGQSFIESFGLENLEKDEPYRPFIQAIEKLFYEKNVPWAAGDLFGMNGHLD